MMVSINNPVQTTWIFILIFLLALLISIKPQKAKNSEDNKGFFPITLTQELKGLAILAVVFSHIGYFLVYQHEFLFPLTILAGVGVNIFLFLSGLGLTTSSLKKDLSVWNFYKQRLLKLFVPLWLVLILFFTADYLFLNISYSWVFSVKAFLGIFTTANIYNDLNSPLWYFTLILFYYLIFPIIFSKNRAWLSAIISFVIPYLILRQNPQILQDIVGLYKTHLVAFPLGIFVAWLFSEKFFIKFVEVVRNNFTGNWLIKNFGQITRYVFMIGLLFLINYFAFHAGIGEKYYVEEFISIITSIAIIILFALKKFEFRLLSLLGIYSYEIYLLHWPIMYRYDFLYKFMSGWLATIIYLILFLLLGFILKKVSNRLLFS
jgi:peptidoglycan/LPS O-acetylase OafA/YrhL